MTKLKLLDTEQQLKQSIVREIVRATNCPVHTRTLIHIEDPHYKYYQVTVDKNQVSTRYGRIGTYGVSSYTHYSNETEAKLEAVKLIKSKLKKGYEEPIPMGETVEKAVKLPKKLTAEGLDKLAAFLDTLK